MADKVKIAIFVLLIISMVFNFVFFVTIVQQENDWVYTYDSDMTQWCESNNDWISYSNTLVMELQSLSEAYDVVELTETTNCWEVVQ